MNITERSVAITPINGQIVVTYFYPREKFQDGTIRPPLAQNCGIITVVHPDHGQMYRELGFEGISNPSAESVAEMREKVAGEMQADGRFVTDMEIVRKVVKNGYDEFIRAGEHVKYRKAAV